jgi:hypothetical protein
MADGLTIAMRTAGAVGFGSTWLAAPSLQEHLRDGNLAKGQLGLATFGGACGILELADHAMSGWVKRAYVVDGNEAIHQVWQRLGINGTARNVALVAASAAFMGALGIGFGSARKQH